jgi:TolA-binding protein
MGVPDQINDPVENKWPVYEEERSKSKAWLVFLVLAAVLGAAAYYGYWALNKQNVQIGQLFGSQAALNTLRERVDNAESRMQDAESRMREMRGGWEALGQRVKKLESFEGSIRNNLEQTRKYAETLSEQLHQQLSAELEARDSALDGRLSDVESEQKAQSSQIAQMEAALKQDVASIREVTDADLSSVHRQVEANARDLGVLSQRLEPKRVDFELAKGQTEELIPGVSVRISGMNPMYQRYSGSLWLLQDRRTLWVRDQSVHEPVRFFHKETDDPYELVVTDVTKKYVIGYLLAPSRPEALGASAAQTTAIGTSGND